MSIALQRNEESALFKKFEKDLVDDAFKYHKDKSLPNHFNIVENVKPRAQPVGVNRQKIIIPIPKNGQLGKVMLKWTFLQAPADTSVHTGCNMAHTIKLRTDTLTLEQLTSEVIYQKIEEHSNDSARALLRTLTGVVGNVCYTPCLFDFTRSVNGWINTVKSEPLHLEIDMSALSRVISNSAGVGMGVKVEALCDFSHLTDKTLMEHSVNDNPVKTMMTYVEDGTPNKTIAGGTHYVTLENSGLCKSIYVCVKNPATTLLDYREISNVKLSIQGEEIYNLDRLENDFFAKSYIGMVSEVYNSADSNIFHIRFAVNSRTNGNFGCLMMNGGDRMEEVTLQFTCATGGQLFIVEEMYEQFSFRPDGSIRNVTLSEAKKMATPVRKRGRPKGSKNATKAPEVGETKPENKSDLYNKLPENDCNEIADTVKPKSKVHFATKKNYKGVSSVSMSVDKLQPEGGGTGGV